MMMYAIYGISYGSGYDPAPVSESIAYNATIDYGVGNRVTIGAGIAYQTATGYPVGGEQSDCIENLTRLNATLRVSGVLVSSSHFQYYPGGRAGASFWTDIVTAVPPNTYIQSPTM